ncbi:MAG: putative lipopolysaccharide glycosyltransferase, partial [Pseudonocardiales bacterium]|nr:putative lipopolysaccharide glycosyltransferase [Pseudonocardiales bacterium]
DQLITGLPEFEFDVQAVVATGVEASVWQLPANVSGLTVSPLWGTQPKRVSTRPQFREFKRYFGLFLDALILAPESDVPDFVDSLRLLSPFAQANLLPGLLKSPKIIELLLERWRLHPVPGRPIVELSDVPLPTVADAVAALDLIDHFLRPLGTEPPRADLCHSVSNGAGCLIAFNAKWMHGVPFLLTEHGLYLRERYLEFRTSSYSFSVRVLVLRFMRLLTSASYLVADFITPGSDYNRRWALRQGATDDRVRPVYNGVDPTAFPEAPEPSEPILTWVGRITPIKDVESLITAFGLVHQEIPTAVLRMYGSAPAGNEEYLQRCRELISELGLEGFASFEGRLDQVVDGYHAGQAVVLSSASEGFPYTVIEAMTSGRATVSTDVGGVREAVGETGLVVPSHDAEALAAACVRVLSDHDLRHQLALTARARALQHFTLEQFLKIYREIYPALVRHENAGPRHAAPESPVESAAHRLREEYLHGTGPAASTQKATA